MPQQIFYYFIAGFSGVLMKIFYDLVQGKTNGNGKKWFCPIDQSGLAKNIEVTMEAVNNLLVMHQHPDDYGFGSGEIRQNVDRLIEEQKKLVMQMNELLSQQKILFQMWIERERRFRKEGDHG